MQVQTCRQCRQRTFRETKIKLCPSSVLNKTVSTESDKTKEKVLVEIGQSVTVVTPFSHQLTRLLLGTPAFFKEKTLTICSLLVNLLLMKTFLTAASSQ